MKIKDPTKIGHMMSEVVNAKINFIDSVHVQNSAYVEQGERPSQNEMQRVYNPNYQ